MATTPFHFYLPCEHGVTANLAHTLQWKFPSAGPTATWTAHCIHQKVNVIPALGLLLWSRELDNTNLGENRCQRTCLWRQMLPFLQEPDRKKSLVMKRKPGLLGFFSTCKHHRQTCTATRIQAMHQIPGAEVPRQHGLDDLKGLFQPKWFHDSKWHKGSICK